jgi:hypothetical protein
MLSIQFHQDTSNQQACFAPAQGKSCLVRYIDLGRVLDQCKNIPLVSAALMNRSNLLFACAMGATKSEGE